MNVKFSNNNQEKKYYLINKEVSRDEYIFAKGIMRLMKQGVKNILEGKEGSIQEGDVTSNVINSIKQNKKQVDKYIQLKQNGEILSFTDKFERKVMRYAYIYKPIIEEVRKGKTKEEQKEIMIMLLHLIHAFGDNIDPETLQKLLSQEKIKTEKITKKCIDSYNRFSDNRRLQQILKKANFFSLEEDKTGKYILNEDKIATYIQNSYIQEFLGIGKIFNIFFYSSVDTNLTTTNLKHLADDIIRFFLEINDLNHKQIAFHELQHKKIVDGFLKEYIKELDLGVKESEMFQKLIENRKKFTTLTHDEGRNFIEEIIEKRKLDFSKKAKTIIDKSISIDNIDIETFDSGSPNERSKWFMKSIIKIDEKHKITHKHDIPRIEKNRKKFDDFVDFMKKIYKNHRFSQTTLETNINNAINSIENKNISIEELYTQIGYELQIVRAWVKFYIIGKEYNYQENPTKYKEIFKRGSGTREMILEGLTFDGGQITISPGAKHNSIGTNMKEMLSFNFKKTTQGHLDIENEIFLTTEGVNFFSIEPLYLPKEQTYTDEKTKEKTKRNDFYEITDFQKKRLSEINTLLGGNNQINKDYKNILKNNGFIDEYSNPNKKMLWNLRIALKYAIFVSEKLKVFHEHSRCDFELLEDISNNFNESKQLEQKYQLIPGNIKEFRRSIHKAITGYRGDFYQNADIVRARKIDTDLSSSIKSMQSFLNYIKNHSVYNDQIVQVIIGDNTGNPNELPQKPSGYRDIKVHLRSKSGNLIEIQFVCEEIHKYKDKKIGISIEDKFLPTFRESGIKVSPKNYSIFEATAKERGMKIPRGLQKIVKNYNEYDESLYENKKNINSDFFYKITRGHHNEDYVQVFSQIEGLYNKKVWNEISGKLNEEFLQEDEKN